MVLYIIFINFILLDNGRYFIFFLNDRVEILVYFIFFNFMFVFDWIFFINFNLIKYRCIVKLNFNELVRINLEVKEISLKKN